MLRVKKISVKKLFGTFDYAIYLNMAERITILHGPNGFGKTTLLTMLSEVFKPYSQAIRNIPFQEFRIEFDDSSYVRVENTAQADEEIDRNHLKVFFQTPEMKEELLFSPPPLDRKKAITIIDEIPWIDRDSPTTWLDRRTGEFLSFEKVLERYADLLPTTHTDNQGVPEWKELKESAMIHFIETQRLLRHSSRRPRFNESSLMRPVAEIYAEDLAREIESKLAEYAAQSQTLDRTFPKRLLEHDPTSNLTDEELNRKLEALEEKRKRFTAAGFLDSSEEQMGMKKISEDARSVLSVYVDDVEKKLSVLDGLANKVELFREIINKRFLYKEMTISKEKGFIFTTKNDSTSLTPKDLSSGEQHELVMFYEFLFKTKPGSLILIDEPEISLHVAWQIKFLRDIQDIIKLADFDVLIATHSPSLISDNWDLTVELKGPDQ